MTLHNSLTAFFLVFVLTISADAAAQKTCDKKWFAGEPLLLPGPKDAFDEISVKDPSVVFFEGMWHVFYTARSKNEYTTGYISAATLDDLQTAPRHEMKMIRGKSRYGCAPQVFYFEPHNKWYLIFQNRDSNYQPAFSTTTDIANPESWSKPLPLISKENREKWIDFWIICDEQNAYLFYTQSHSGVIVRKTSLEDFPNGWDEGKQVFDGVHEAVHIYKVKGRREFHMIYELNSEGIRSFGLAKAENLAGPWKKVTDNYATGDQLSYSGNSTTWTEMVSHGEVIREGYNQQMEYDPIDCRWLIQGIMKRDLNRPYPSLPWKLGIINSRDSNSEARSDSVHIFTDDGAWCWFQDPRAVYVKGKHERTYAQWMTRDGKLQVGAFDHETGKNEIHTLKENWGVDDHNVGAFIVLPDKRLMIFYARHNKQGIFCRTSSSPEDISDWDEEVIISNETRITYAHPVYLSEEKKFYVFWRGPSWKPTFSTSGDGKSWSAPEILIQDKTRTSKDIRPYTKIASDGKSTIHFAFTDGHPGTEAQNSVYYLKYKRGQFFRADGNIAGNIKSLPVHHTNSDIVYDGKKSNVRAWVWDIFTDEQGTPVIAYTRFPDEKDHRYCYARWNGKEWMNTEITSGGKCFPHTPEGEKVREPHYSGGIALNHSNPYILYLSRQINNAFEIEKWQSPDKGKTWVSKPITINSEHINARPVVPSGYAGKKDYVLWMFGSYEHYTKYKTGIKLYFFLK